MSAREAITQAEALSQEMNGAERSSSRPRLLSDFVGQKETRENLSIFIEASRRRGEALDHVLLAGPPGLGKTTLAHIIARERQVNLRTTSGPALQKPGDLAALLTGLEPYDVLFIDEIHRLTLQVEEIFYSALEDFALDLMIGEGVGARSVRVALNPFTLVGATTRSGLLSAPLRDRFGISIRLDFYHPSELAQIVERTAGILGCSFSAQSVAEIARRARGTPRIAERLLRRVRDFALPEGRGEADHQAVLDALARLKVDEAGLDDLDHLYLRCLTEMFAGRAVGIETLAAALGETRDTLEDGVEPYLLRQGLILRTPRGRVAASLAYKHLGLTAPQIAKDLTGDLLPDSGDYE